jgi:hypothetical protein
MKMNTPITPGTRIVIEKGCRARDVVKGQRATVETVTALGADYGHSVKVQLRIGTRLVGFHARHMNRLSDFYVSMNDGNPLHKIIVRRA